LYYEKEKGWNGILIEPNTNDYYECIVNRPSAITINAALGDKIGNAYIFERGAPTNFIIKNKFNFFFKNKIAINIITLEYLFKKLMIKNVDLLILDTEGFEYQILQGNNFDSVKIKFIAIEVWDNQKKSIFDLMEKKNYELLCDLSEFNYAEYPHWLGNHNDYLFGLKNNF